MFVEDEEPLVELVGMILEEAGFKVTAFRNPLRAVEQFAASPQAFDAVLTDLSMTEISGMEVARRVIKTRPDIPVLMISGSPTTDISEQARAIGIKAVLRKPVFLDEITAVLDKVIAASD